MAFFGRFGYQLLDYDKDLKPLPGRCFRVLQLLKAHVSAFPPYSDTFRIKIHIVKLDELSDKERYNALSYSWGAPSLWSSLARRRVIIETDNGPRQIFITSSLFLALTSLWSNSVSHLPIFVDQICINQDQKDPRAKQERHTQIKLMGDIYQRCTNVIVWLGPGNRGSDSYFDFVTEICGHAVIRETTDAQDRLGIYNAVVSHCLNDRGRAPEPDKSLDVVKHGQDNCLYQQQVECLARLVTQSISKFPATGYADVLQREWFNRLWVIQEVALARDGLFLCGDRKVTFEFFRAAYYFYALYIKVWAINSSAKVTMMEAQLHEKNLDLTAAFVRIFGERKAFRLRDQPSSLADLVKKFNVNGDGVKVGATKRVDRIVGLLGLSPEPRIADECDCTEDVQVYTRLAEIEVEKNADILLFAQKRKSETTRKWRFCQTASEPDPLPSWVPDWSIPYMNIPYGYVSLLEGPLHDAGGSVRNGTARVESSTLRIRGLILGRIAKVGIRQIRRDRTAGVVDSLDWVSLKHFCDEIDLFVCEAANIQDDDMRLQASLCLTDGGLSLKRLKREGSSGSSLAKLYAEVKKIFDLQVRASEARYIYTSFSRTWKRHPPVRWPLASVCFPPLLVLQYIWAPLDVGMAVARMWCFLGISALVRLTYRPLFHADSQHDVPSNVVSEIHRTPEMHEYRNSILRNQGRKLYQTQNGLVGLGPEDVQAGDYAVVLFGGSVPFILREKAVEGSVMSSEKTTADAVRATETKAKPILQCSLIGEAYCYGIMNGEALVGKSEGDETTFLIS